MSEKTYVRFCEKYTVWEASKPIEVDVEKLRKCEPPYEGDSDEELLKYLMENVFNEYEWYENETNKEVYGEEEAYELTFEEWPETEPYSDSREKFGDTWLDVGVPNEDWRKYGGFEVRATSVE